MATYYTVTGIPVAQTRASSSQVRGEFVLIQTAFASVNTDITAKGAIIGQTWTGTHTFPATTFGVTASFGATGTAYATLDFVNAVATSAVLPGQGGNAGKLLVTNGTTASWAYATRIRSARTSNTILAAADIGTFVDITSGTFTQTLTAAATLGSGWYCWLRNSGTGVITLDPNGAETIDGLTTRACYGQEEIVLSTDGTSWFTEVIHPFYFKPAATATFIMPSGYLEVESDLTGASAGGGSGRRGAATTNRSGGAPGGAPGRVVRRHRNIVAGTSITITIGAAGSGGAAQTVNDTDGVDGTAGGNTSFGTLSIAYGGAAGKGGSNNSTARASTSGSGSLSAGSSTNASAATNGGLPRTTNMSVSIATTGTTADNLGTGGAASSSQGSSIGGNSEFGGAGSASGDPTNTTVATSGSSIYGVSAAGIGGHITNTDTMPTTAGTAGLNGVYVVGGGAPGGTCGASPTAGTAGAAATTDDACGNSGGGGGSSITAAAAAGGAGGFPGGAGGGGGASLNGFNSGPGGAGAAGRGIIKGIV